VNDPQLPTGLQLQSTPAFVESLETTAVTGETALINKKGDGCGSKETVTGDPREIVITAEANFVGSAVEVAWTVTVPPVGTADGAVYVVGTLLAV